MEFTQEQICDIVRRSIEEYEKGRLLFTAEAGVTRRHVILCAEDRELLFGKRYSMGVGKQLRQPREYLYKETLTLAGNKTMFSDMHILAGDIAQTQVVLARSDMMNLGLDLNIYEKEGRFPDAAITLIGPAGLLPAGACVKIAERSITLSEYTAKRLNLADGDMLSARAGGGRLLVFHNARVKTGYYTTEFHLDADEANGAGIHDGDLVEIGYF